MKRLLVLLSLIVAACSNQDTVKQKEIAKPVKTITLNDTNKTKEVSFPGRVIAAEEAVITFKVPGKLERLPIKEGQEVKKGDILAELDKTDYKIMYEGALATFNQADSAYKRAKELIKNRYISQANFDLRKKAFEVSQANLNKAKQNLDYATLKAPFAGQIAKVYVDNFQNVQIKENIANLQNLDFIDVQVFVSEKQRSQPFDEKNLRIEVSFDALPNKIYLAKISEFSTQADPQTQTYSATVRLPRPTDLNIFPGMTATVKGILTLENTKSANNFNIPADAVFSDDAKNSNVWVINHKNRLEKRIVTPGNLTNNLVNIVNGLKTGETVVTTGVNFLHENQLVTKYNK